MTKQSTSRRIHSLELVAAITLGLLAIACFILQAYTLTPSTTPKETVLFNCLQFLLTVGFAWFSTRAVSRYEFEQSIKRFAISAYRRIADIERMVTRLNSEVKSMINENSEVCEDLHVVEAIVLDTEQIVRSSIADWADVIGEELLAIEKIKRLENEKVELKEDSDQTPKGASYNDALEQINKQITELRSTLPARLQLTTSPEDLIPIKGEQAADWMAMQHRRDRGLNLMVVTGDGYPHDRDFSTIKVGEDLHTVKTVDDKFDVADPSGSVLGRLQNNSPLSYKDFIRTLESCYGATPLSLKVIEINGSDRRNGTLYAWFTVKVLSQPTDKTKRSANNKRPPDKLPTSTG